jgi:hypothetical protein
MKRAIVWRLTDFESLSQAARRLPSSPQKLTVGALSETTSWRNSIYVNRSSVTFADKTLCMTLFPMA